MKQSAKNLLFFIKKWRKDNIYLYSLQKTGKIVKNRIKSGDSKEEKCIISQ